MDKFEQPKSFVCDDCGKDTSFQDYNRLGDLILCGDDFTKELKMKHEGIGPYDPKNFVKQIYDQDSPWL